MNQETLNLIITSVVVPLLVALGGFIVAWISKKSKEIQSHINNDELNKYITIAENAVSVSVLKIFQTYVDTLKKSGTFGEEEQRIAFTKAKFEVMKILTEKSREAIAQLYGDLDTWLESQIEFNVAINKPADAINNTDI